MNLVILPASQFSLLFFFLVEVAFALPALTLCCLFLLSLELTCCWHMLLAEPFEDALKIQSLGPVLSKAASMECISPVSPRAPDAKMLEELKAEPWYQGEMSRKEAEGLLKRDGDFLVRKSTTNPGSFVLTGMHNGQAKHLLLVDPEGTVRPPSLQQSPLGHCTGDHFPSLPTYACRVLTVTPLGPWRPGPEDLLSGQSQITGAHG